MNGIDRSGDKSAQNCRSSGMSLMDGTRVDLVDARLNKEGWGSAGYWFMIRAQIPEV